MFLAFWYTPQRAATNDMDSLDAVELLSERREPGIETVILQELLHQPPSVVRSS
jgi:hypothetical protein